MADNVTIPPSGVGDATPVVAADDIAGVKHQRVKVEWGVDGTATEVTAATPLPVVQTGTPGLPTGAATQTTLAAVLAALGTPAQASGSVKLLDSGGSNQASISATGAVKVDGSAQAQPVNDNGGSLTVDDGSGSLTVDGTITANLGTIAGVATAAKQPALGTVGVPSADFITVQGNASGTPIPVSGTFSASGTTDLTASGSLAAPGSVSITTLNGMAVCDADVSGTYTGTLISEGTIDGTNWFGVVWALAVDATGGTINPNSTTSLSNGRYQFSVAGFSGFRLRASVVASGSYVIALRASAAPGQNTNTQKLGGNLIDTNSGVKSPGTQRVILATDQPALSTPMPVADAGGSLTVDNAGTFAVQAATELATGLTTFSNTALSNTKTAVKASAGKVYGWMIHNPSAATVFIQVWNVAIGSITVGTTAPTYTIPIPAGASANVFTDRGITHSAEINIAATTTATGSSAPATASVVAMFYV